MQATASDTNVLNELLLAQRVQVNYFFDHLDIEEVEAMYRKVLNCDGTVFFTGVGKSGIIAEKLAVTMVSTGTRSHFVPPTNALHGDLGIVRSGDLFIILSKSGESDELMHLIPYIRNKGAEPIAWVSTEGSRLARACDLTVHLPFERELCPFNLSPTTSASIQLLFGDVLAVAVMRGKKFTIEEYATNHPAGRIGKRITLRVRDLMLEGEALPIAAPDDKLSSQLVQLSDKRCGCLLICEGKRMLGIFTDGDLRRSLQSEGPAALDKSLGSLMTTQFRSIRASALAYDAMRLMESDQKHPVMVLPVLNEEGALSGLIKMHDIVQSGL